MAAWHPAAASRQDPHPWQRYDDPYPQEVRAAPPQAAVRARPGRVVLAWGALTGLVVVASILYLSLSVYTAQAWRQLEGLKQQLQVERRREQILQVQLARVLTPQQTEQAARAVLAMERPREVDLVLVQLPATPGRESLARADGSPPGSSPAPSPGRFGLHPLRLARALEQLWPVGDGRSLARALRWPQWP